MPQGISLQPDVSPLEVKSTLIHRNSLQDEFLLSHYKTTGSKLLHEATSLRQQLLTSIKKRSGCAFLCAREELENLFCVQNSARCA